MGHGTNRWGARLKFIQLNILLWNKIKWLKGGFFFFFVYIYIAFFSGFRQISARKYPPKKTKKKNYNISSCFSHEQGSSDYEECMYGLLYITLDFLKHQTTGKIL